MTHQDDQFDRFFEFYFPRIYTLAWRRRRDEQDAQAVTQQVLTALLLRALPRGLARAVDDPELQRLAIRLLDELSRPLGSSSGAREAAQALREERGRKRTAYRRLRPRPGAWQS
jgi:hypothetical protein